METLNLSAKPKKTWEVVLPNGKSYVLKMANKGLIDKLSKISDDATVDDLFIATAEILSCNVKCEKVKPSELEKVLDYGDITAIISGYQTFIVDSIESERKN